MQPCVFRIDYQLEAAGNREFGSVFVNEKENVAVSLVAAGLAKVGAWRAALWGNEQQECCSQHICCIVCLAGLQHGSPGSMAPTVKCNPCRNPLPQLLPSCSQVRTPGGQQSPFYEDLAKAQADAESRGLGVWTKDKDALAAAVRDVPSADGADLRQRVELEVLTGWSEVQVWRQAELARLGGHRPNGRFRVSAVCVCPPAVCFSLPAIERCGPTPCLQSLTRPAWWPAWARARRWMRLWRR